MNDLQVCWWPIERPRDYPKNARKWSAQAIAKVGASLRAYGFRQPVVVDRDEVIIIGHLRRAAARKEGFTEIPVHVAHDLTPAQVRGLRLMDNRSHEERIGTSIFSGPSLRNCGDSTST
jgi:ParB-like chromosome segregation protein Spo0J